MSAFFEMGGYGAFVWSAYGLTALVLALLAAGSWRKHKRLARTAERARAARRGRLDTGNTVTGEAQ